MSLNMNVAIDKLGTITPLSDVSLNERTYIIRPDENILCYTMVLILANMSLGLLMWKLVVHQLRPKDEPEKKATSNAA